MLRILGRANSFNVRKVLWVCDELGLAFEREDWGRGYQSTSDPRFLELNPIGLVPAVVDDDIILRESNTIVRYLATKHGDEELYPRDAVKRAHVEAWMDWANYETSISLRGAFLGGITLGLAQALAVFALGSGLKNVAALSVLLVFLFFRPSGILGATK